MLFANPPLVELVAELRWVAGASVASTPGQPLTLQFPLPAPQLDETFSRFSEQVATKGFGMSERLVPVGFPYFPFSVVYRFRKSPAQGNFLYQIGPGVFSANALPPYRNWESFRPTVEDGIQALLESRQDFERGDFTAISLRYIDLFSEEFTSGMRSYRFLNEVLGIKLALPRVLIDQIGETDKVQSGLQLSIPLKKGLLMNLNLQEGAAAGKNGILMIIEVLTTQPTPSNLLRIMETLENAHDSIRVTFLGLTEKLTFRMNPVQ